MKLTYKLFAFVFLLTLGVTAQEKQGATLVATADSHTYVESLASRMNELTPARVKPPSEMQDARAFPFKSKVIPGKGNQRDVLSQTPDPLEQSVPGMAPDLTWVSAFSNSQPTDPSIAVGPDHVLAVFNTGFAIYDKDGNELVGQTSPNPAIFPSSGCCDLTVSYDPVAVSAGNSTPGRWVLSFLGGGAQVAVSDGPDPITSGWNVYNIGSINDYQKLSVWSDGYYVTDQANGNRVYAMERQAMIEGAPAADVSIQGFALPNFSNDGFASVQVLNISDDVYPTEGNATVVFYQDDSYSGVDDDSIKFWDLDVDFETPGNSTISDPQEVIVTPFTSVFDGTSFANLTQPGGQDIDALQGIVMNQAQYKKFGTYNAAIFNFVIDVGDGTPGNDVPDEQAAIRWYEFRQTDDGQPWTLEQEGTYAAADGSHYWHASMIFDNQGNVGMGYTAMSNAATFNGDADDFLSSYYTGRLSSDPAGAMTIAPQLISQGAANIPGSERYGDYSKIDIDPSDYKRMYFVNEYMNPTNAGGNNVPSRSNIVGRFQIAPNFNTDAGVITLVAPTDGDLSLPQDVTVTIRNFGLDDISDFDVSYQVDTGTVVTENFGGTITAGGTADHTFATQADLSIEGQTYTIVAATDLGGDEDNNNDSIEQEVTHIFANDVGATAITSPNTGEGLGNEIVTITIENFGTAEQSNFDVSYTINGGPAVTESVAGPLAGGATLDYSFTQTADMSAIGSYVVDATTALAADAQTSNDPVSKTVINLDCVSTTNDTDMPIGPNAGATTISAITITDDYMINDVNVNVNIEHTWVGDLDIVLVAPDNSTQVVLASGVCGDCDDMIDVTFDDQADNPIGGATDPITGEFQPDGMLSDLNGFSSLGEWRLVITDNANQDGGQLLDWTLTLCEGEPLSIQDQYASNSELVVLTQPNNQFKVVLPTTEITSQLRFTVTNLLGQTLAGYRLENENGEGYEYDLDMSYAPAGVYIVRIGNKEFGGVKRIIVK